MNNLFGTLLTCLFVGIVFVLPVGFIAYGAIAGIVSSLAGIGSAIDVLQWLASSAGFIGTVIFWLLIGIATWAWIPALSWLMDRVRPYKSKDMTNGS